MGVLTPPPCKPQPAKGCCGTCAPAPGHFGGCGHEAYRRGPMPIRWVAHRALPLVYDDSLSYMELLSKVACGHNELVEAYCCIDQALEQFASDVNQQSGEMTDEFYTALSKLRDELVELIRESEQGCLTWDVQHGWWTGSVDAMRDMFNDLTVHGITCCELAELDMTVCDLAESGLTVRGLAVAGRALIEDRGFSMDPTLTKFEGGDSGEVTAYDIKTARKDESGYVYIP